MPTRTAVTMLVASTALVSLAPLPVLADGGLTATAQTQIVTTGGEAYALPELGLGYDLGPKASAVPVRVNVGVRDAFATGPNGPNVFSAGVTARLTTPLYFGAGASLDVVSAPRESFAVVPVSPILLPGGYVGPSAGSNSGIGGMFFVGQRLVKTAGVTLSLEAGYRFLPSVDDEPTSGAELGFRLSFR